MWRKAHEFVLAIYRLSASFPKQELYALNVQLRRAAVSNPANIAEGSLEECRYYLILSQDLGYAETSSLKSDAEEVSRLLTAYTAALLRPQVY